MSQRASNAKHVCQLNICPVLRNVNGIQLRTGEHTELFPASYNASQCRWSMSTASPVAIITRQGHSLSNSTSDDAAPDAATSDAAKDVRESVEEVENIVYKTIDHLPYDLKTVITLREIDGLTYEHIARVMQCPIGTVRSRIFRARELIDQKVKALGRI